MIKSWWPLWPILLTLCLHLFLWWQRNRPPKWMRDYRREHRRIWGKPMHTSSGSITESKKP